MVVTNRAVLKRLFSYLLAFLLVAPMMASAASYQETQVTNGGSIKGKVTFEGTLPTDAVEQVAVNKNPEVCGEGYREVVWIDVNDGALRGSFVYLDKIKEGKAWTIPEGDKYKIIQKGCRFRPWAQVVRPGPIHIVHKDKGVQHNINMVEMIGVEKRRIVERPMINRNQPEPSTAIEELKTVRAPHIALNCEVHNFMFGFMMAPKNPYAVVVAEDGSYSLDDVPPGEYTVKAWHPRLGVKKSKLTVSENGKVEANFVFSK